VLYNNSALITPSSLITNWRVPPQRSGLGSAGGIVKVKMENGNWKMEK